jgi:pyridine nucleotide-disulfide oxidoreductase family protein
VKRVLLLGAGHAHLQVLQALAAQRLASAQVALVTPHEHAVYSGMVPGLVAGHYTLDDCRIPLRPLADAAGVHFITASAMAVDAAARRVQLSDGSELAYDVLSLDTGAPTRRDALPGAQEHALRLRPLEHFVRLLEPLWALAGQHALDVVVIGGGAAGFETALALSHRFAQIGTAGSRVALVTGGGPVLDGYPDAVRRRGAAALRRAGVTVMRSACTAIAADHVRLDNGARAHCDAPVLALGAQPPAWLAASGLALDEAGFVATGPTLQSLSHAEVFAAGDVASRPDAPHPRSGVQAVRAGPALAENLRRYVGGGALLPHTPPARTLNLISCGDRQAIAAWGGWSAQGRWAWWWKDRIDRAWVRRFAGGLSPEGGS